jgi:hypothetical protein
MQGYTIQCTPSIPGGSQSARVDVRADSSDSNIRWNIHGSYLIYNDSTFGSCQTRYWYLPIGGRDYAYLLQFQEIGGSRGELCNEALTSVCQDLGFW